jgi:hypothetical protein
MLGLSSVGTARAMVATNVLRDVLVQANPDVRACARDHRLDDGRYVMGLTVDWTGKVTEVELGHAAGPVSPAAASCLEAAFTRLQFSSWRQPEREPATVSGNGRVSRVPPAPATQVRTVGLIRITWPLVLRLDPG